MFILGFIIFTSFWFWKILNYNLFLSFILILTTFTTYRNFNSRIIGVTGILLFTILLLFQVKFTEISNLTTLNNNEITIQQQRINEYPQAKITLFNKTIWVPIANWFELRKENIVINKITENFSEVIDLNLYFFANHPRERNDVGEFEKFHYLFVILFLVGIFSSINSCDKKWFVLYFLLPVFMISFIGNKNPLGSFSLFPFIVVMISAGIKRILKFI